MRRFFLVVCALLGIALCGAGYYLGRKIPFASQWPLFEALRNTAAIIFAVVGAWLAIIYPERLKLSFRDEQAPSRNANIGLLLTPAVHSTLILVVLLLVGILAPLLKQLEILQPYFSVMRGLSFLLLTLLTLWQVVIVVMAIFPAEVLKDASDREMVAMTTKEHYKKLVRRAPPGTKAE